MPNVHGVEFNTNQSELVKEIVRELLKDGNCAAYAVPHIKPHGEIRVASIPTRGASFAYAALWSALLSFPLPRKVRALALIGPLPKLIDQIP